MTPPAVLRCLLGPRGGREGGSAPSRCEWLPDSPGGAPPPTVATGNTHSARRGRQLGSLSTASRLNPFGSLSSLKTINLTKQQRVISPRLTTQSREELQAQHKSQQENRNFSFCVPSGRGVSSCASVYLHVLAQHPRPEVPQVTCLRSLAPTSG